MKTQCLVLAALLLLVASAYGQFTGTPRGGYGRNDVGNGCQDLFPDALTVEAISTGAFNRDIITINNGDEGQGNAIYFSTSQTLEVEYFTSNSGVPNRVELFATGSANIVGFGNRQCSMLLTNEMYPASALGASYSIYFACDVQTVQQGEDEQQDREDDEEPISRFGVDGLRGPIVCTARYTGGGVGFPPAPPPPPPPAPVTPLPPPTGPVGPPATPVTPPDVQPGTPCYFVDPDPDDEGLEPGWYSGGGLVDWQHVVDCLDSTNTDSQKRDNILDYLDEVMDTYAYREVNAEGAGDFEVELDLDDEIERMRGSTYDSDWAFHNDIVNTFVEMRDRNTGYTPPACYGSFTFGQIFQLAQVPTTTESVYDGERRDIVVGSLASTLGLCNLYEALWNSTNPGQFGDWEDPNYYRGWVVREINDVEINEFLQDYGDANAPWKDPDHRFQWAVNSWNRQTPLGNIPPSSSATFFLEHPVTGQTETVTFPWLACTNYQGGENLFDYTCNPRTNNLQNDVLDKEEAEEKEVVEKVHAARAFGSGLDATIYGNVLREAEDEVGVLDLSSFHDVSAPRMFMMIARAVHRYNMRNLIVDVTSLSTSGDRFSIAGAGIVAAVLSPVQEDGSEFLRNARGTNAYDMRVAPVWNDFWNWYEGLTATQQEDACDYSGAMAAVCDLFEDGVRLDLNTADPLDNLVWYNSNEADKHGDAAYSQYIDFLPVVQATSALQNTINDVPGQGIFTANALAVTTNGWQPSNTASLFIRLMQEMHNAKIIGLGGTPLNRLHSNSGLGGVNFNAAYYQQAMRDAEDFGRLIGRSFSPSADVPDFHPQDIYAGVFNQVVFATYQQDGDSIEDVPREFFRTDADDRMDIYDANPTYEQVIYQAMQYFECCFDWSPTSCDLDCTPDAASMVQVPVALLFIAALLMMLFK